MIFGLSRIVFFAGLIATAGAAGGLWYVMSEDERNAPVAQRESVIPEDAAPSQPEVQAPAEQTAQIEAERQVAEQAPDDDAANGTQATDETDAAAGRATRDGTEDVAHHALAESHAGNAQIETLIDEDVATLGDPAAPAPEVAPEIAEPRLPAFDTIRVEPSGEAVIAGRDAPEGDVALLRDGEVYDETFAGPSGAFVFIPRPFPAGTSDVTLRATDAQGNVLTSRESVTIIVDADRAHMPMVALTAPGRPTEVLSRPDPVQTAEAETQLTPSETAVAARPTGTTTEPGDGPAARADRDAVGTDIAQRVSPRSDARDSTIAATSRPAPDAAPADETGTTVAAIDAETDMTTETDSERAGVRIVAVEAETGGGLFVSGEAEAQAAIRLYLNDTLVARAEADDAGDVSFAIRRGVRAGRYQVRLDDVDPATGTVLSRAAVDFTVPEAVATLPDPEARPAADVQARSDVVTRDVDAEAAERAERPVTGIRGTEAGENASPAGTAPGNIAEADPPPVPSAGRPARSEATVVVPELSTASVERGDSLWRISRDVYGRGIRYTEIFEANQNQIRNPDLIYPGQVFVLPPDEEVAQDGVEARAPAAQ